MAFPVDPIVARRLKLADQGLSCVPAPSRRDSSVNEGGIRSFVCQEFILSKRALAASHALAAGAAGREAGNPARSAWILRLRFIFGRHAIDRRAQDGRGFEGENAARLDRHFDAGARIAADAFSLVAHQKAGRRSAASRARRAPAQRKSLPAPFRRCPWPRARKHRTGSINGVEEIRSCRGFPVAAVSRSRPRRSRHLVDSPLLVAHSITAILKHFGGQGETGAAVL